MYRNKHSNKEVVESVSLRFAGVFRMRIEHGHWAVLTEGRKKPRRNSSASGASDLDFSPKESRVRRHRELSACFAGGSLLHPQAFARQAVNQPRNAERRDPEPYLPGQLPSTKVMCAPQEN